MRLMRRCRGTYCEGEATGEGTADLVETMKLTLRYSGA
jgi:hypothetical protein